MPHKHSLRMTASAITLIAGASALAQDATPSASLEEIVVTARKTEEKLQEVPLSIKALTGADLQARGITSVSELSQYTPGLSYSPDFGRVGERPVIRGISALRTEAPQPVSIFVNGIFVRDGALSVVLDDAQRVEVIKGPQSSLYGRSTYAGAINYITTKPGNEFAGRITGTIAEAGESSVFAGLTLPIVKDQMSLRLRGKYYKYGGDYTNSQTGNKIGNEKTTSGGAELVLNPTENFDANITADYAKDRDGLFPATVRTVPIQAGGVVTNLNNTTNVANGATCNGRTINIVGNNTAGIPDPAVPASLTTRLNGYPCGPSNFTGTTVRRNENDLANYTDPTTGIAYGNIAGLERQVIRLSATLNFRFADGYTLTSLSGYTDQKANTGTDQSYNGTRFAPAFGPPSTASSWLTYDRDKLDYTSQELRLLSPQDQPLTWLAGVFYYKEAGKGQTTGVIRQNNTLVVSNEPLRFKSGSESRNMAAFGRLQYALGDQLKVSAEGRYGEEKVSVIGTPLGTATVTVGTCTAGQVCSISASKKFKSFAPRFTVDFKPMDDVLIYAQAAKGTKSGGFNTTPGLPASSFTFDGETIWSYEVGAKSEFLDNRVRVNLAAFQNDVSNLQLSNISTVVNPFTGASTTTTIVNNVGKARTKGFEVELAAKPVSWLTLSGNYAYTDAKAIQGTETTNGTAFGGNRSVAGFTLPRSPKHSGTASAAIDYPVGDTDFSIFARGDLTYQSRRYAEIQNLIWADPFTRINVSGGIAGKGWKATAFMKNVGNSATSLNGFRYLDPATFRRTAVDFLPRLRQFGGKLSFEF